MDHLWQKRERRGQIVGKEEGVEKKTNVIENDFEECSTYYKREKHRYNLWVFISKTVDFDMKLDEGNCRSKLKESSREVNAGIIAERVAIAFFS
jgi:hypothetical protein